MGCYIIVSGHGTYINVVAAVPLTWITKFDRCSFLSPFGLDLFIIGNKFYTKFEVMKAYPPPPEGIVYKRSKYPSLGDKYFLLTFYIC